MNEPSIRFKQFGDSWEIVKLKKLIRKPVTDGPHETPRLLNFGIPFISIESIHDGIIDLSKCRGYISKEDDEKYKRKYIPEIGDVYFTKAATIGRVAIVKKLGFNIRSPIGAIKPKKDTLLSEYLYYVLQTSKIQNVSFLESNSGTQHNLGMDKIEEFDIPIPLKMEEQGYISNFLSSIDLLIRGNEQKLEKFRNIKESFLQKMFPKNGKNIPVIRFDGFNGEWKKVKLKNIFNERREASTITSDYPQLSFTIAEGVINPEDRKTNKRDFLIIDKANKKYLKTEVDDIIYNPSNIVFGAIHRNGLSKGVVSPIYKIFYTDQNPKFLDSLVTRKEFINETKKYLEGTVTKLRSLKPEAFLNIEVLIPPTIEEQKKIGEFFESIDKQIKTYEPKIEKLKNLKQSLLEKMFI